MERALPAADDVSGMCITARVTWAEATSAKVSAKSLLRSASFAWRLPSLARSSGLYIAEAHKQTLVITTETCGGEY